MKRANGPKIVMVGGGSYNWMPKILSDIIHTPELEGGRIILLDPNLKAAEEVKAAACAMSAVAGGGFMFHATKNEASAFRNADFVLITISTGGLEMMQHDLKIPEKYGIFATVGDTVGPGGWSRNLRNVPVFAHLAAMIEKHAPRAVVMNYTNPMAALTGTITEVSGLRAVGLCHGVFANYHVMQQVFGVDEQDLSISFGGVNHFFWILDFAVKDRPGYPLLRRRLGKASLDEILRQGTTDAAGWHSNHLLCDELFREYGYLPYVGDRHTCEFFPHYITPKAGRLRGWNLKRTSIRTRKANLAKARKRVLEIARKQAGPFERSRETAVDIMCAVAAHKPFFDVVNLPNTGQIENLPRGAVVETLGLVDDLGFRPVTVGRLPQVIERLVAPHCHVQMMTLRAALEGDRELALQALMLDPLCAHLAPSRVRKMGTELMQATREYLPQFK